MRERARRGLPLRYGLVAGAGSLLLLALLGATLEPATGDGGRASVEAPAASTGTGLVGSAQARFIARGHIREAAQRTVTVGRGLEAHVESTPQPTGVLMGRILGPEGLGLEGARIELSGLRGDEATQVRTGPDGRFETRGLEEETYELRVTHPRHLPVVREIRLPRTEPLELALSPAAAVLVKVYGERGEPVEQATVSLWLVGEGRGETVREEATSAQGSVRFGELVPGSYVARVRAPGCLSPQPIPVEAWDEESEPVTLIVQGCPELPGMR